MAFSKNGQLTISLGDQDKASFESFWSVNNNELITALQSSVCHSDPTLIYLYGPSGSGKSHLLFSVMRLARQKSIDTRYVCLTDDYVTPELLSSTDMAQIVCVDDAQAWSGEEEKERALFTLFEQVRHAKGQLFVSARQAPDSSGFLLRDLVSRLSSGLIYPIIELDDTQRAEALKLKAKQRGFHLSDDVVKFLMNHVSRDTTELFRVFDLIDRVSLVEKRKVTIPFLQTLLHQH